MENQQKYVAKIMGALQDVFENKESEFYIDLSDIKEGDEGNDLVYSFGCIVPAELYQLLTKKKVNALQFNHIANVLCFQNMRLIADKEQRQNAEKILENKEEKS